MIAAEALRKRLRYNPETGEFTWLIGGSGIPPNRVAGALHARGYIHIVVCRRQYKAHRLAWLYMTGEWPRDQIDHINGIKADNRWKNLRQADNRINQQNKRRAMATNSVGLLGAFRQGRGYCSKIRVEGRQRYLGTFDSAEAAHAAYMRAKAIFHEGYVRDA